VKIFIDVNILVAELNKEYPLFIYASIVLSWIASNKHQMVTAAVSLAITYYFAEKKHGTISAKERIIILAEKILISDCGNKEVLLSGNNKK